MKKNWMQKISLAIFAVVIFTACAKDKKQVDKVTAEDMALATSYYDDIETMSDQAADKESVDKAGPCASVTIDTSASPHEIIIDFGSTNCLCSDSRYRRGKLIIAYTGRYRDEGSSHTITPEKYFVNDNQVRGVKTVVNKGRNGDGNLYFEITENGEVVVAAGSGTITWNSTRTREWVAGENTVFIWRDDAYLLSGQANGVNREDRAFAMDITTPLRVQLDCRYVVSGTIELKPDGYEGLSLDYGTGDCDNEAELTFNDKIYQITLR